MRRKDVSDLVEIQERQNHRDAISANQTAMEKMRISLLKLESDHKKEINEQDNKINSLKSDVKCNKELAFENYREHRNKISDLQNENLCLKKKCIALDCEKQRFDSIFDDLSTKVIDLVIDLSEFKKEDLESQQYLEYAISKVQIDSANDLKKFKKQLNDMPSELDSIKEHIDAKLEEKQIDHDGIYINIEKFKSKYYIVEKQIENIYTLIKRLEVKI